MTLILGSQSPRRKEILSYFSYPFIQDTSFFDERAVFPHENPAIHAQQLSTGKAKALLEKHPHSTILTADTVVYKDGKYFDKPVNENEAFDHLKFLVGDWHEVITALTLIHQNQIFEGQETTRVLLNDLTSDQIVLYHTQLPCADKAGGYMIQGAGSIIVKKIEGCYFNVMGLPINLLQTMLKKVGIDLWNYLKSSPNA